MAMLIFDGDDENALREMLAALATECETRRLLFAANNAGHFFSESPEDWAKLKRDALMAASNPNIRRVTKHGSMRW